MPELKKCRACGVDVQTNAPFGHCPKCLLELGFGAMPKDAVESSAQSAIPNPQSAIETVRYFGDYELLEQIGRGGMGIVYKARQQSLNRIVALKMISAGEFASPSAVQRFQIEAEAAAKLDHPNIVPIYEIGVHRGQHYFSMGFVEGRSLAEEIRDGKFRIASREGSFGKSAARQQQLAVARLMATVARSVHHAHRYGILHRDLKPGNILLDGEGQPHLTDFGLAKILEHEVGVSGSTSVLGTPGYMSPEQANARPLTTATDVYSLGAILYELLTGRPPFSGATPMEIFQQLAQEEPAHPQSLNLALDRDLATICLKCLEKDPAKRYPSAEVLADELARFIANEPIMARSVSRREKVWRWCKRKPALAGALSALLLTLLLGVVGVSWQWREAVRNAKLAAAEATEKQHVATFLRDMLGRVRPSVALGRDTALLRDVLKDAERRLQSFPGEPKIQADLRRILGATYLDLGDFTKAEVLFRDVLAIEKTQHGDLHLHAATAFSGVAQALEGQGRSAEAEALHRQALAIAAKLRKTDQTVIAELLFHLAGNLQEQGKLTEAEVRVNEALAIQKAAAGVEQTGFADTMNLLAGILRAQGKFPESEAMFQECLAKYKKILGEEHPQVAMVLGNIAAVLQDQGKLQAAEAMSRDLLPIKRRLFGSESAEVASTLHNLGTVLISEEKWSQAEAVLQEALALRQQLFQSENPTVIDTLEALASLLQMQKRFAEAETQYREILALRSKTVSNDHPAIAKSLCNLALAIQSQERYVEAERLHRDALALRRKLNGGDKHPDVADSLNGLAGALLQQGKVADAEAAFRQALDLYREFLGEHEKAAGSLKDLAFLLQKQLRLAEAETSYRGALAIYRKVRGNIHAQTLECVENLAWVLEAEEAEDKLNEAERLFGEAITITKQLRGEMHLDLAEAINRLAALQRKRGKLAEAETNYWVVLDLRKKLADPAVAESWYNLGLVFVDQRKWTEAESAFRAAVELGRTAWTNAPLNLRNALDNYAAVLSAQNKRAGAEPLLIEANALMQNSNRVSDEEKREAIKTLSNFYMAWAVAAPGSGKIQKSMEWDRKVTEFDKVLKEKKQQNSP